MTLTLDTYDVWLEQALEYVRDQLRTNSTVGLNGSEGVQLIEIGVPDLEAIRLTHPGSLPIIVIHNPTDRISRVGGFLDHRVRVELHTFSSVTRQLPQAFEDQKRHREFTGRVYNQTLNLRDGGNTAGHWLSFDPDGETITEGAASTEDRAVIHSILPFNFKRERAWIQGGT